jgi:flagellar motility protein MotE (MotC chaperone)
LLPVTISTIALLLVVKCGILAKAVLTDGRYADTSVVTTANAADHGASSAKKPSNLPGPPLAPPPGAAAPVDGLAKGPQPPVVSDSEKALLQDLRQRRQDLEARETAVAGREAVLGASEKRLDARVAELQSLRRSLEDLEAARKQKQEAGWQGLVKVYEAMKPRDAATIFNDLSMPVLLQVLDRMKDAKAAPVMAAMTPEKAREVTSELAQLRMTRNAAPDTGPSPAAAQPPSAQPPLGQPPPASAVPLPAKPKMPAQAAATRPNPSGG